MNVYTIGLIILLILFLVTILSSLYIRKYRREDISIVLYVLLIAISQFMASRITIFDFGFAQIVAPAAVIAFPFTFQLTDQVNENFGRKATHRMVFIAFLTQVIAVLFLYLTTTMPQINDNFTPESYNSIMISSFRITIASWISFIISENFDAYLFHYVKELLNGKHLWVRNTVSDVISLGLDSLIFVPLAFFGVLPTSIIPALIIGQLGTKWTFGLIDTPYIYLEKWVIHTKHRIILRLISAD